MDAGGSPSTPIRVTGVEAPEHSLGGVRGHCRLLELGEGCDATMDGWHQIHAQTPRDDNFGRRVCENARGHVSTRPEGRPASRTAARAPSPADAAPVTLDPLELRNPVLAVCGAVQGQAEAAADLGQPFVFGLVVLVAVLAGVFVYWRRHNALEDRVKALTKLIEDRDTQLREADHKLKRLAGLDSVSEIANHGHFQDFLRSEWPRALREASSILVIMVDFDHLKDYNDEVGYPGGDECLKHVAKALSDSIGRPGDSRGALRRRGVWHRALPHGHGRRVSRGAQDVRGGRGVGDQASALPGRRPRDRQPGGCERHTGARLELGRLELLATATRALLQAKQAGRNRVIAGTTGN